MYDLLLVGKSQRHAQILSAGHREAARSHAKAFRPSIDHTIQVGNFPVALEKRGQFTVEMPDLTTLLFGRGDACWDWSAS
jgi:hypothetical protein